MNKTEILVIGIVCLILFFGINILNQNTSIQTQISFIDRQSECVCNYPEINLTDKECYTTEEIKEMKEFQYAIREMR